MYNLHLEIEHSAATLSWNHSAGHTIYVLPRQFVTHSFSLLLYTISQLGAS